MKGSNLFIPGVHYIYINSKWKPTKETENVLVFFYIIYYNNYFSSLIVQLHLKEFCFRNFYKFEVVNSVLSRELNVKSKIIILLCLVIACFH